VPRGIRVTLMIGGLSAQPVPAEVAEALQEVQVTVSAGQRSGFQLRFAVGKGDVFDRDLLPSGAIDPPSRVIVVVTVDEQPTVLMDGVITRHDLAPGNEAGKSTLTVTGVDVSQMMDLIDISAIPLPAMPAEARVLLLLAPYAALYGVLPVVIPSVMLIAPSPTRQIPSRTGTDYAYISRLADEVGYVFYVEPGSSPGQNLAYWGPEIRTGEPQPALTVNSDAATNVESLSFSFDGIGKTLNVLMATIREVPITIPVPVPDITPLNPPLGAKIPPPLSYRRLGSIGGSASGSSGSASGSSGSESDRPSRYDVATTISRGLARAAQSANVISATGSLDVLRYGRPLRARRLVGVRGAGPTYDGEYYVKSVSSSLKPGEFTQRFSLSRNAQVSVSGRVRT
jgi:hypothetical protein